MAQLEGWGFLCLIGCGVSVALSLSLLSGGWQVAGLLTGVALGVMAGGLYAASVRSQSVLDPESSPTPERRSGADSE